MSIIHNPDSEYSRELAKWDTPKMHQGMGANGFEAYPTMLYKAFARDNGKVMCGDPLAAVGDAVGEAFARSCQLIVHDEEGQEKAIRQGWAINPDEAIDKYERNMVDIAEATAKRHYADQGMSESAKKESLVADNSTHEQVPEVPRKKKRGRQPLVQVN